MDDYNNGYYEDGDSASDMMWTDYDYHRNTDELSDYYPEEDDCDESDE